MRENIRNLVRHERHPRVAAVAKKEKQEEASPPTKEFTQIFYICVLEGKIYKFAISTTHEKSFFRLFVVGFARAWFLPAVSRDRHRRVAV